MHFYDENVIWVFANSVSYESPKKSFFFIISSDHLFGHQNKSFVFVWGDKKVFINKNPEK